MEEKKEFVVYITETLQRKVIVKAVDKMDAENQVIDQYNNEEIVLNEDSEENSYVIPDSDSRYLYEEELDNLTAWQCKVARNEILARHGRRFKNQELQSYFDAKSWYHGDIAPEEFLESEHLNQYEIENMYFIKEYENAHGYK